MSAWDLCEQNNNLTVGFSGTNDSKIILPDSMTYYQIPNLHGTSGKVISKLCNRENDQYESFESHTEESEMLKRIMAKSIRVILDVGALIIKMTNQEVAKEWLRISPPEIEACVFFSDNDLVVLDRKSDEILSFETSQYNQNMKNCLVYLNEIHCRGTDLR